MTGEACATGRPVYVFHPSGGSAKFTRYHDSLMALGATRPLPERLTALEEWAYEPQISADLIVTHLQQIKDRYPTSDTMILIPDEGITYGEIIQAMDCARRHHEDSLFPNVVLAASLG